MNILRWQIRETSYHLWIEEDGQTYQATGTYYPFFQQFKKNGYDTEIAFILAVHKGQEDVKKLIANYNRAQGYKKKLAMQRIEQLIPVIKSQDPHLSDRKAEEEAYKKYCEEVDRWSVNWTRLNQLDSETIKSLKRKKAMTVADFKESISLADFKGAEFQTIGDFMACFSYESYDLNGCGWLPCPFIKGHLAKIKKGAVLSFNHKTKEGFVFDIIDLAELLFNMKRKHFFKHIGCCVIDFEMWQSEIDRYHQAIKRIGYLRQRADYPYMNRLLDEVWDFFAEFLRISKGLIATDYFLDGKAVVFRSLRLIQDDMVRFTGRETVKRIADRVNLLCAVGLLEKVKMEDLPENLQYENGEVYDCNYYRLPEWNIRTIESRSQILVEQGIRIGSVTKERVEKALGYDIAQAVFNEAKDDMVALANIPF